MDNKADNKVCTIVQSGIMGASAEGGFLWEAGQEITVKNCGVPADKWEGIREGWKEWERVANLRFVEVFGRARGQVRVGWLEGSGSWSMIGTDCLNADPDSVTMCFGWEEKSVFIHEFGHVIGLNHSQNAVNFPYHFNRQAVIDYYSVPPNNWPLEQIKSNIFDRAKGKVVENAWENRGVMEYWFPASMIVEGIELTPGEQISQNEIDLCRQLYPF